MIPLRTIAGRIECETEIKKSRFVAVVDRAATEAEARAVIESARKADPAAGHHCSAFIVDSSGDDPFTDRAGEAQEWSLRHDHLDPAKREWSLRNDRLDPAKQEWSLRNDATNRIERSNDDGEPSGTAGMPMLEVLRGHHITNVVAVVSRYFGGTKLGTGGLARAYGGAVNEALSQSTFLTRERRDIMTVELDHVDAGRVESELRGRGVVVLDASYLSCAVLTVAVADADSTVALVASLTAGRVVPVHTGHMYAEVPE
ncbi:putative uncharacterized protein [Rhodococcus sp. AW25M09]|uniref:IMPACT family protein n=1 Tax=Rhodococcus sp. AW25M09 TaxID=1268303 RepID=UPI0002AC1828|nr:YigZ family protein [Rhodococcus sp. AW25M09]CCQ15943.1 putative uncharacterized protein [Rhodococcus sp. AW25M09]